jgi:hypothetical protein
MNKKIAGLALAAVLLAAAAWFVSAGSATDGVVRRVANAPIIQVSDDPFTNPTSQHRTEVEPDTFAFGSTWVTAFQAGLSFAAGSSGIGFATSTDQGDSFVQGVLPGITGFNSPAGPYDFAADSSVAFDRRDHVWLISYLAIHESPTGGIGLTDVLVSRSADGVHWDLPVPVAMLDASLDKDWTVCDNSPSSPFYGNCYTEFNGPTPAFALYMSTSSDGGLTWGAPEAAGSGNAGQPLVQPSGRVVVPYFGLCAGTQQFCAINSDDGGDNWTIPTPIAARMFHGTQPNLRSPPLPSAAIDRDGRIYLVWKDCRFEGCQPPANRKPPNDLVMSTSDDGVHWSDVQRIPLDPIGSNVDHFLPGIGVDPESAGSKARLALTYYFLPDATCTTAGCELDVGYTSSTDGGQTWTQPQVLATMQLGWLAQTDQGRMVGDYISTSVFNGGALVLPAFAAATPPDPDGTLHEAIYTILEQTRQGDIAVNQDPAVSQGTPDQTNQELTLEHR